MFTKRRKTGKSESGFVPISAVESMGMGGLVGAAALRQQKLIGTDDLVE